MSPGAEDSPSPATRRAGSATAEPPSADERPVDTALDSSVRDPSVLDPSVLDPSLEPTPALDPATPAPEVVPPTGSHDHRDHHVLIDADEDRWKWRARIRRDPRKLFFYRMAVAFAGMVMICLGAITGPLPGPGGIPLVLLGIAIWSSEFEWAHRLMQSFKRLLDRYRRWTVRRKIVFWALVVVLGLTCGYSYLRLMGVPFWMPAFLADPLRRIPGL